MPVFTMTVAINVPKYFETYTVEVRIASIPLGYTTKYLEKRYKSIDLGIKGPCG